MKSLACLLLLVATAVPAAAQQVEIIGIDHTGMITWSNTPTPLYCGVEAVWNLNHTWLPLQDWNLHATTAVTNTTIAIADLWDQLDVLTRNLGTAKPHGLFFRIVASPSPLGPRYATNLVEIVNASTSVLANVEVGLIESWSHNPITNWPSLAQGASTPIVPVVQDIPLPGSAIAPVMNLGELVTQEGWYVSYDHDASNRVFESMVIPFGEPEKDILVTISNASVTALFEWFGLERTFPY